MLDTELSALICLARCTTLLYPQCTIVRGGCIHSARVGWWLYPRINGSYWRKKQFHTPHGSRKTHTIMQQVLIHLTLQCQKLHGYPALCRKYKRIFLNVNEAVLNNEPRIRNSFFYPLPKQKKANF